MKVTPDQGHSNPDNNSKDNQKRHVDGGIAVRGELEVHPPPKLIEKHDAERKNDAAQKGKEFVVSVATLVSAVIYAGLTALIVIANWNLFNLTRKTSEREDRAWVAVHPVGPLHIAANEPLEITFTLMNTGKSPARHIVTDVWVQVVPIKDSPDLSENGIRLIADTGDLFQNDVNIPDNDPYSVIHGSRQKSTSPRTHDTDPWPMSEAEYAAFMDGKVYVVGSARVEYDDIFHVRHWTRFCASHLVRPGRDPDGLAACAAYNKEDDTEEP